MIRQARAAPVPAVPARPPASRSGPVAATLRPPARAIRRRHDPLVGVVHAAGSHLAEEPPARSVTGQMVQAQVRRHGLEPARGGRARANVRRSARTPSGTLSARRLPPRTGFASSLTAVAYTMSWYSRTKASNRAASVMRDPWLTLAARRADAASNPTDHVGTNPAGGQKVAGVLFSRLYLAGSRSCRSQGPYLRARSRRVRGRRHQRAHNTGVRCPTN